MLIGAEGAKTPAGVRGRGDPSALKAPRRLPATPAESEAPFAALNRLIKKLAMYQLLAYNKKNILF